MTDLDHMTDEELRQAYNDAPKPNAYGDELLRRIHARDRVEFGMSGDNPALTRHTDQKRK